MVKQMTRHYPLQELSDLKKSRAALQRRRLVLMLKKMAGVSPVHSSAERLLKILDRRLAEKQRVAQQAAERRQARPCE